jgi:NTE family protein
MPPLARNRKTALILAGGVAKGAFEAGALRIVAGLGLPISQIVGASSGALNAAIFAAGIRASREADAAERLAQLWQDDADWMHIFHFSLKNALEGYSLSDSTRVLQLLRSELPQIATAARKTVGLRIVVGVVRGATGSIGDRPATTFEGVVPFDDADFDEPGRRDEIYSAAAASAAFPGVFAPVDVDRLGPCYDGGVVNDAPLRLACESGAEQVIVIAPYPAVMSVPSAPTGLDLVMHLVDMLIHERLYRDLREAERLNNVIAQLTAMVAAKQLSDDQLQRVLTTMRAQHVDILTIRPSVDLPGNTFDGFRDRALRAQYIAAGEAAARAALTLSDVG